MKKKKEYKPKLQFADRLELKLLQLNGKVDSGVLSDNSARWLNLRRGKLQIAFTFNVKGDVLEDVGVFEDVIQVVDERKIF